MSLTPHCLSSLYQRSHDLMRNIDGLQPPEAFDELLKYMFVKECADTAHHAFPAFTPSLFKHESASLNEPLIQDLRQQLKVYFDTAAGSPPPWPDPTFHLSDTALLGVHEILENVDFATVDMDTRSTALKRFFRGELRKGLGIFPTPDGVARMMVAVAAPDAAAHILDPACGTGTFLMEVVRRWHQDASGKPERCIWGVDKNPRMLLLSELNLGHNPHIAYRRARADALYQSPTDLFPEIKEGFDLVLTNPPFGVVIDRNQHDMTSFLTCRDRDGNIIPRQQSEVVFVEQCLKYLKPGGLLGIVLPRSIVTNSSLGTARQALNQLGYLETIVNLPPETFVTTGTQTNTLVLFVRRYQSRSEGQETIQIASIDVRNVGFDATGRPRRGGQLAKVAPALQAVRKGQVPDLPVRLLPPMAKDKSLAALPDMLSGRMTTARRQDRVPLQELVEIASTGKTPGRAHYAAAGLFLAKVGNLTGHGINWKARDRNYVAGREESRRRQNRRLMLAPGDLLLTSSAHSPVYIARKVDIVAHIPQWVGGEASYVGEVMRLRPRQGFDPYVLLAYLRLPTTQQRIQTLVRGQTAHLHPRDLLALDLPRALLQPPPEFQNLVEQVRQETQLFQAMNELAFEQRTIFPAVEKKLLS